MQGVINIISKLRKTTNHLCRKCTKNNSNANFDSYLKTVLRGQRHYQTFDSVIGYTQSSAAVGKVIWQWGRCEELLKPKKHVV